MSCMACTKRYGLFCKEFGCPNCKFSFCSKCLKKEIEVPRCGGNKLKVCLKCFERLEKEKNAIEEQQKISGEVLALDEPLVDLAAPIEPINTAEEALPDEQEDSVIADNLDSVLSKRLKILKDDKDKTVLPTYTDMASRLANLKGVPYKEYSKAELLSKDTRTEQEKINDLIKEFLEEKSIDEAAGPATDPISDIKRRLAILKGQPSSGNGESSKTLNIETEEDEEAAAKKILEKYLEEAKLPDAQLTDEEKEIIQDLPKPTQDNEELPWCTICNEDATIRCVGCDGDLFCSACFRECHDDEDFKKHEKKPYSKPPNFKEDHF